MSWLKIDDAMIDHPKIVGLSDAAFRAHMAGLCYCARHQTDGHLPLPVAEKLAKKPMLNELKTARLWMLKRDGYWVKNYLEYNPSRDKVEAGRAQRSQKAAKAARARWDAKRNATSIAPSKGHVDAPIPIPHTTYDHPRDLVVGADDHRVNAEDLDPAIRHEIERLVAAIPHGERSTGRLVRAARAGAPQAAFADARQALTTVNGIRNPGAYACDLVERYDA